MASVFKRDKKKRNSPYLIQYTDQEGKRRTETGFSDRGLTEQLAAKLETEAELRRRGLIDPKEERLAKHRSAPIADHLAAFEKSLGSKDNSRKHVKLTMSRIRRIIVRGGMETAADIDIESVEQVLDELRETDDIGHRTYNHYVQAIDSFCNWTVATKRTSSNPLLGMERLNTEMDIRHPRRALTPEEVANLVESARNSGVAVQSYTGEQRARVYIFSYMTGLRRAEMASLTPQSFDLKAEQPILQVKAGCSKHRKTDVLPLHPDLLALLRDWLRGMESREPLFPRLDRKKTWLMVKKDLERVGIPYETEEGIADFHAAGRHTHITGLLRNGAALTDARELARHGDIRMTMRYTHVGMAERAKALAMLPALQMRCISRGADCQEMAAGDTRRDGRAAPKNPETPAETGVSSVDDAVCQHLTVQRKVEAAGIEPASRDISMRASTCVVGCLSFARRGPSRQGPHRTSQERVLTADVPDVTRGDPELRPTFGTLRQSPAVGVAFARRPLRGFPRQVN